MIYDITPFSTLDFPGRLAAIFWFAGCNMRCVYCYNPQIVRARRGRFCQRAVADFLQARRGLLDGVVASGGECTQSAALQDFCALAKGFGFAVKIDSNGSNPAVLAALAERGWIDFCSLDFKACKEKFAAIAGVDYYEQFWQSFEVLQRAKIPFEVRTTVHEDLLAECDIRAMAAALRARGYEGKYALQAFCEGANLGGLAAPKKRYLKEKFTEDESYVLR